MIEVDANDCEMNAAAILDLTHQESWSSLTMRNGPANVLDGPFDPLKEILERTLSTSMYCS